MENASQALIIAAGILIGILILTLGSYLYIIFGDYVSNSQAEIAKNSLAQFNNQFLKYNNRTDLTIQDVVTVKNIALKDNYKNSEYNTTIRAGDNNVFVDVYKNGRLILDKTDEELLVDDFENDKGPQKYTCIVEINSLTARVNKVIFTLSD
jgi:hypothetical protein